MLSPASAQRKAAGRAVVGSDRFRRKPRTNARRVDLGAPVNRRINNDARVSNDLPADVPWKKRSGGRSPDTAVAFLLGTWVADLPISLSEASRCLTGCADGLNFLLNNNQKRKEIVNESAITRAV